MYLPGIWVYSELPETQRKETPILTKGEPRIINLGTIHAIAAPITMPEARPCRARLALVFFNVSTFENSIDSRFSTGYGAAKLQYLPSKMIYHFTGLNHFSTKIYHFTGLSFYQDNLLWFHFPVYHFTRLSFFSKFGFIILPVYHFTLNSSLSFYRFIFVVFCHSAYSTVLPSLLFEFELTCISFALPEGMLLYNVGNIYFYNLGNTSECVGLR